MIQRQSLFLNKENSKTSNKDKGGGPMQSDSSGLANILGQDQSFGPWMLAKKKTFKKGGSNGSENGKPKIGQAKKDMKESKKGVNTEGSRFSSLEYANLVVMDPKDSTMASGSQEKVIDRFPMWKEHD